MPRKAATTQTDVAENPETMAEGTGSVADQEDIYITEPQEAEIKLSTADPAEDSKKPEPVIQDGPVETHSTNSAGPETTAATESIEPTLENTPATKRRRQVLDIQGQRSELTAEAKKRSDLIDLTESMKGKRIMTGTIAGIERSDDNPNLVYAVIYYGSFKIIIPADELIEVEDDAAINYRNAVVSRRLGAQVDFIVRGIDARSSIAAASRIGAMLKRRREFWNSGDTTSGDICEARVISVIRSGIFVELYGLESYIPLSELSYLRINDAATQFRVGDPVLVKVLKVDQPERGKITLSLSVKQAGEDTFQRALERYKPNNLYVGCVSLISAAGVFVTLDEVSCLCQFPKRGRPAIGTRVTVKILGVSLETKRLWGVIIH